MAHLPPEPSSAAPDFAPKAPPASVLAAPRTPVTRWNRRYILAGGAALAGIIAIGFYIGFGGANPRRPQADANAPAADVTPTSPGLADRYPKGYGDPAVQVSGGPGTAALPAPGSLAAIDAAPTAAQPPPPVDPAVQQARAQALAARSASPFFQGGGGASAAPAEAAAAAPRFASTGPGPDQSVQSSTPDVQPANGQGSKRQFVASAKADDYLANPLRAPLSRWEVKAGTVIPAALITAINSDLPGEIIAQVTQPVYDHVTGRTVLIPQGSRLIGQYDSQVAYGQDRALIAWNRIVMPDGRSINIGTMEGADLSGASGLRDRVNNHGWQLAKAIMLSTVFSVGAASAQDAGSRSSSGYVLNSAGTGISAQAQQVGEQITNRDLNRQPTITIRAGWPLRVLVNKDMILAPYP